MNLTLLYRLLAVYGKADVILHYKWLIGLMAIYQLFYTLPDVLFVNYHAPSIADSEEYIRKARDFLIVLYEINLLETPRASPHLLFLLLRYIYHR